MNCEIIKDFETKKVSSPGEILFKFFKYYSEFSGEESAVDIS